MMRISALIRARDTRACFSSLCHVRTQWEGGHLQTRRRAFTRTQLCLHIDLGLPASRTVRKYVSVV